MSVEFYSCKKDIAANLSIKKNEKKSDKKFKEKVAREKVTGFCRGGFHKVWRKA